MIMVPHFDIIRSIFEPAYLYACTNKYDYFPYLYETFFIHRCLAYQEPSSVLGIETIKTSHDFKLHFNHKDSADGSEVDLLDKAVQIVFEGTGKITKIC